MRLLHITSDGGLSLTEDLIGDDKIPPYAILSHTWQGEQEVTFDDLMSDRGKSKAGYKKIRFCAQQALRDGLQYCWVDTCSINKSSSSELSEAINSMFRWYQNARKCYVYLSDVSSYILDGNNERWKLAFKQSRWFTRGWTLQELIAPRSVEFFSDEEDLLGSKEILGQLLYEITGIPIKVLQGGCLSDYGVAERFSWAEKRQTTRGEDESYCLLGIFGVHLPLIYGEGQFGARKRLLKEVEGPTIEEIAKRRILLEWISPTDYPAQQSDIISRRQDGTCQWFLNAPEFARWLGEPNGTLFCPGIPGAGKTMAATIAINHLLKVAQNNSSVGIAYVYCNYKSQEKQDATSMLAAILKQLVQAQPPSMKPVERLYQQQSDRGTKPSFNDICSALQDVLVNYTAVYLIIDALDECRDSVRRQFQAKLSSLQAGQDIRVMVTSRFNPEIEEAFSEAPRLEIQASQEDVKRFVAGQMYRLPRCIQRNPALQDIVQDKIVGAVDGMFLLARLLTDSLLDKTTPKDVKLALAKLSKGSTALDDAYKDAIQRIEGQLEGHHRLAKKVLSWITFAKRPLTTAELCCALAVEPGEMELDLENTPDVEDLISVCAGLVVVDRESGIIRLVHYTTQEFFERIRDAWIPTAQVDIAKTCFTYLSFSVFQSGSCLSNEELDQRFQESDFLDYAAKHWGEHAIVVEDEICELACTFLSQRQLVSSATQVSYVPDRVFNQSSQIYPKGTTGLHLAARFGLSRISEAMIRSRIQESETAINRTDSYERTPLYIAAEHEHYRLVEMLVIQGADINAQGGWYGNALQAASYRGHEQIAKLLVDKGADVNAQGGMCGTALQAASYSGHEHIAKLLVENGADVNALGGAYGHALQAALAEGNKQIVRLLIDKGADINMLYGPIKGKAAKLLSERKVTMKRLDSSDFDARYKRCRILNNFRD